MAGSKIKVVKLSGFKVQPTTNNSQLVTNTGNTVQKKVVFIITLILLSLTTFNAYAFKIRSTWSSGQKYVYLDDVARFYGMKLTREKKSCTLSSKYSKLIFNYNSMLSNINGVTVYLSFPVNVTKVGKSWIVLLSEKDFLLLVDPVLRKNVLSRQNVKTVVIDPGHGGKDIGAKGKKSREKDIALQVAKRLSAILKKAGYKVVMTRSNDTYLSLGERPAVAERYKGDIFVSIHCNATTNTSTQGIETFIFTPQGTKSTYGGKTSGSEKGNKFSKNNSRLGYDIQKKLLLMKSIDRGLKHSRFKVLRLSSVPAVLVELGFISSSAEEANLMTPNYQYLLAYRIAEGIVAYSKAVK
jgi:N-acetylmuramoyl-L-alanine amidase